MEDIVSQPATKLQLGMFPSIRSGVKGAGDRPSAGEVPQERDVMCLWCLRGQKSLGQRRERAPQACRADGEAEGQGNGGWGL